MHYLVYFFFFKQKTAYEMRISDWSSDVCSSDLKWRVKAAYSRRVQRSTNNELNPYPEREHSETLEQGDPDILPEFIGLTELGMKIGRASCRERVCQYV